MIAFPAVSNDWEPAGSYKLIENGTKLVLTGLGAGEDHASATFIVAISGDTMTLEGAEEPLITYTRQKEDAEP
jgi:hypothetical protein